MQPANCSDSIVIKPIDHGSTIQAYDPRFPSRFTCWSSAIVDESTSEGPSSTASRHAPVHQIDLSDDATHFGFVHSGQAQIHSRSGDFQLKSGMYFSIPGAARLSTTGTGFLATRLDYLGFFHIGGPIEKTGRLEYIDGCSDSLLIPPVVLGDPCLNFLYLPPGTKQTQHTHPSCRLGMIVGGHGICRTADRDIALQPGLVFQIPPDAIHSFHTEQQALRVIAWHPDSDCGPSNHDHPMINKTIIDGISAAKRRLTETSN